MKLRPLVPILLLFAAAGLSAVAAAQTPAATAAAAASPTNPVPDSVLTPGSASLTPDARATPGPSTTPAGPGSNLYSIPNATPSDMPAYSITPVTPGAPLTPAAGATGPRPTVVGAGTEAEKRRQAMETQRARPMKLADCSQENWRNYSALRFKSREQCELWTRKHQRSRVERGIRGPGVPQTETPRAGGKSRTTPKPPMAARPKRPSDASITPLPERTPTPVPIS